MIKARKYIIICICCIGIVFAIGILVPRKEVNDKIAHEMYMVWVLRGLYMTELTWNKLDADNNGKNDFWVGDVAGLYYIKDKNGRAVKVISYDLAVADLSPVNDSMYEVLLKDDDRMPKRHNGYYFMAMQKDENGNKYHNGDYVNETKFAFIAIPWIWTNLNHKVFIINEEGKVYFKDTMINLSRNENKQELNKYLQWPENPIAEGWKLQKIEKGSVIAE